MKNAKPPLWDFPQEGKALEAAMRPQAYRTSADGKFKIERLPLPESKPTGRRTTYPWDELAVGESFFVSGRIGSGTVSAAGARRGRKFSRRKVDGGVRIWRVK